MALPRGDRPHRLTGDIQLGSDVVLIAGPSARLSASASSVQHAVVRGRDADAFIGSRSAFQRWVPSLARIRNWADGAGPLHHRLDGPTLRLAASA